MPRYDMRCPSCQLFIEDIILTYEAMKQYCCPECATLMGYVPSEVVVNTSESKTFVRVSPERKAAFAAMRERKNSLVSERKERNKQRVHNSGKGE